MREKVKKLVNRQETRFLIVGAANTAWGLASYPILYFALSPFALNYLVILIITYTVNTLVSFVTQKYLVFKSKKRHLRELLRFIGFQLIMLTVNLIALPLLIKITGLNPMIAQTCFVVFVIVSSYFFHNYITFRKPNNETEGS